MNKERAYKNSDLEAEEQLERAVFELWETGMSWEDIAKNMNQPLSVLLSHRGIEELYLK